MEAYGWILCFAHTAEHSPTNADLACTELQQLRNQIRNIHPLKKDMRQFSKAQQHGVMTGSQILSGMKERDGRDNGTKAKKTNSGAAHPTDRPLLQQSEKPHQFLLPQAI